MEERKKGGPGGGPQKGGPGGNPLGTAPVGKLLAQFAVPSIISTLIAALYNIVDQIFIGQRIGMLGNAATTVAFPLTFINGALTLLFSNGSAVNFNLNSGRGDKEEALCFAGNGLTCLSIEGVSLGLLVCVFTGWFVRVFGSTDEVFPYALTYMRVIAVGLPFLALTSGGTLLVRSDGSPRYALFCSLSGVALNFVLDWLFLFPLDLGIAGAAWATVTGQIVSALLLVRYLLRFKTGRLERRHFRVTAARLKTIAAIGAAASFNQAAMMVMNTVRNNTLRKYGALSVYGASEALAAAGVVTKVNNLFYSTIVGCGVGASPIMGFNFGAKKYGRVTKTYFLVLRYALIVGALETACFWLFPDAILRLFGSGAEAYRDFAVRYMHVFMLLVLLAGVPTVSMHVMTATGKARRGILISLSKQFALIALLLTLPRVLGIDGALWAGPAADLLAAVASFLVLRPEFRSMRRAAERLETEV